MRKYLLSAIALVLVAVAARAHHSFAHFEEGWSELEGTLVELRYFPVFLNPDCPDEGEPLDDYLLREYGYSKEFVRSDECVLRVVLV